MKKLFISPNPIWKRAVRSFLLSGIVLAAPVAAQTPSFFTNPVIRGELPDPSVIRINDTYYATGTSSEWAPYYPLFMSKDLIDWQQIGHVFTNRPAWTSRSFWAPELFYHRGKVYCYYTARQKNTGISYIGVATSDSSLHEFVDHGPVVEYGTEAIDAFVYNDAGQLYISWKAYGLDKRPIELLGCKLSADGLRLEGDPFSLLTDEEGIGMEGQYHFKRDDYYYIVYSAHGCCGPGSDYDVHVARSRTFRGPYEKYESNPILRGGEGDYLSCGHGTAVETPDGRLFYLCHAYLKGDGFYMGRQPILQEMEMTDDHWVRFKTGNVAVARQPVPFEGARQKQSLDFEDRFDTNTLKVEWTWNYPYAEPEVLVGQGKLVLSGVPAPGTRHGTALCVRARSSEYVCETQVINCNESLKGLTLYGDDENLIVWGVAGRRYILKSVKDGVASLLYEAPIADTDVYLKIAVERGCYFRFYRSKDGKNWQPVLNVPFDGRSLIRWDRVQRPGLLHEGEKDAPAEFAYFKMHDRN